MVPRTGTGCLADGRRFEGEYLDDFPTLGTFTDVRGARFMVEMKEKTHVSRLKELGDGAFKSKVPLQVDVCTYQRIYLPVSLWINADTG
jgi:hypothetical protein